MQLGIEKLKLDFILTGSRLSAYPEPVPNSPEHLEVTAYMLFESSEDGRCALSN